MRRYRGKISGPLLDRIDLHVEVPRLPPHELRADAPAGESSEIVKRRVASARAMQLERCGVLNAQLGQSETLKVCRLHERDQLLLERAIDRLRLSARSMQRILRVARTIADLNGEGEIRTAHLSEALGYRRMDRGEGE